MKIAFDGRVLERKMTGVGRYLINILDELPNWDKSNQYFIITNNSQKHIQNSFYVYRILDKPFINSKIFTPLWLNYFLPPELEKDKIDVLIGPNILVPTKKINNCFKISIVHDIMPLTHPEYFPFFYKNFLKVYLPSSIKSSDLIITISEASKKSICEYFNFPEEKIKVVYNTISKNFRKLSEEEIIKAQRDSTLNLPEKFLIYVGVIEKRKNIDLILKLAENLDQINNDLKILLVGKPGYGYEIFKSKIDKLNSKILELNQVSDKDLLLLYNKAKILLFPSFVEGFGLPPIEAMACGTPVIASNCEALKEIIGEAGILCEPSNLKCLIEAVKLLLNDQGFYSKMVQNGLERVELFTREKMIKSFLDVYKFLN